MTDNLQRAPLISAGVFLGIGLGGFVDGIVFYGTITRGEVR